MKLGGHRLGIDLDVVGRVALGELQGFQHQGHVSRALAHADHVAGLHAVGGDVHPLAVHQHVAVVDELAGGEHRRHELGADRRWRPGGIPAGRSGSRSCCPCGARLPRRSGELLLGEVAVVALQLLLGAQLQAEVGHLVLAALAVLAGAVGALVDRGLRRGPRCSRPCGGRVCTWRNGAWTCVSLPFRRGPAPQQEEARSQRRLRITRHRFRAARSGRRREGRAYEGSGGRYCPTLRRQLGQDPAPPSRQAR